jgi:colanic acid/amylovoran biosynthesis glycosyltransferase
MIHYMTTQGLGQPWVGNELRTLDRAGIPFVLHAMRGPEQALFESDWAAQINRQTRTLYPLPWLEFALSLAVAPFLFRMRFMAAMWNACFGRRENMRARLAAFSHFLVACHWARRLRCQDVSHIHAQWAHSSASIAMYGAWLLGKTFSFTGHAVDLFRDRVALADKIRRADFIVCISEFHRKFFLEHGARPEQLHIVYCGIDSDQFTPGLRERSIDEPFRIVSAGRLVPKKGFEYLIDACKVLMERDVKFQCVIAGSGPIEQELRNRLCQSGLMDKVSITGRPLTQESIPAFMHTGDVFVLPCVWAADNDVDGLPQLTMEAMACGLPAITTRLVGNPDLVIHRETGLLVEPGSVDELVEAIVSLMHDPAGARRLAAAGRRHVEEKFDIERALRPLVRLYQQRLSTTAEQRRTSKPVEVGGT